MRTILRSEALSEPAMAELVEAVCRGTDACQQIRDATRQAARELLAKGRTPRSFLALTGFPARRPVQTWLCAHGPMVTRSAAQS